MPALDRKCMVLAPWCERIPCEEQVKERTKATGKVCVCMLCVHVMCVWCVFVCMWCVSECVARELCAHAAPALLR